MPPKRTRSKSSKQLDQAGSAIADQLLAHAAEEKVLGNQAYARADTSAAVFHYSRAMQCYPPDSPELVALLSNRSLAFMSRVPPYPKEALQDAEQCLKLDPRWIKGHHRKGKALEALGRLEEAQEAYEAGLNVQPGNEDLDKALRSIIAELDALSVKEESPDEAYTEMARWLEEGGGSFPSLYVKGHEEGFRAVHAGTSIQPDQELLRVPLAFLITTHMGRDCPVGQKLPAVEEELTAVKHCYLCVFVLTDRTNPGSFYHPYYNILPKAYPHIPLFWSQEDLRRLEGSFMLEQIEDRRADIKSDFELICQAAPEFSAPPPQGYGVTLHDFTCARVMVASRNFSININGVKTDALVPYADLLNHLRPRETKWTFDQTLGAFTITSLQALPPGAEVHDSYGRKCNSRFLLNYGFAVENNTEPDGRCQNELHVWIELPQDGPCYQEKLDRLYWDEEGDGRLGRSCRLSARHDDPTTVEAFSYARAALASGDKELSAIPKVEEDTDLGKAPISPISCENERRTLELFKRLMEEQLAKYPVRRENGNASVDENGGTADGKCGVGTSLKSNRDNALVVIRGEQDICRFWLRLASAAIPLLRMDWKDAKRVLQKTYGGTQDDLKSYIHGVVAHLVRHRAPTCCNSCR